MIAKGVKPRLKTFLFFLCKGITPIYYIRHAFVLPSFSLRCAFALGSLSEWELERTWNGFETEVERT